MGGNNKFIDKFSNVAMRVGGQIHLKALRDTFATIMPLYILAGVAVLINNVVLPFILKGNALVNAQYWGTVITNGTLNPIGSSDHRTIKFDRYDAKRIRSHTSWSRKRSSGIRNLRI